MRWPWGKKTRYDSLEHGLVIPIEGNPEIKRVIMTDTFLEDCEEMGMDPKEVINMLTRQLSLGDMGEPVDEDELREVLQRRNERREGL